MFIYLSKKIKVALPNPIPLDAISWNREYGWIACGGDEGLLKIIKIDAEKSNSRSNLSMNQTLEGHNGAVKVRKHDQPSEHICACVCVRAY